MAPALKRTTGIVGLDVVPNAREVLIKLYQKTLRDLQIIPEGVSYRQQVEEFTKYRMQVVQDNENIVEIERIIGCGQVEQLIEQAKGELTLIPEYASWKIWEVPEPSPDDDEFSDIYDDLEFIDASSLPMGLRQLAEKRRAEAAARRQGLA